LSGNPCFLSTNSVLTNAVIFTELLLTLLARFSFSVLTFKVLPAIVFDNCEAYSIAIQSSNKIVVGGNVRDSSSGKHYFALARYTLAGVLDTTFGNGVPLNGTVVKNFNPLNEYFLNSIVIDNSNKIHTTMKSYKYDSL
jgi:hypothetical protein